MQNREAACVNVFGTGLCERVFTSQLEDRMASGGGGVIVAVQDHQR